MKGHVYFSEIKTQKKKALKKTLDFTFGGDERKNSQDLREASRQLAVPFVTLQRAGLENCLSFFSANGVKDMYIVTKNRNFELGPLI